MKQHFFHEYNYSEEMCDNYYCLVQIVSLGSNQVMHQGIFFLIVPAYHQINQAVLDREAPLWICLSFTHSFTAREREKKTYQWIRILSG